MLNLVLIFAYNLHIRLTKKEGFQFYLLRGENPLVLRPVGVRALVLRLAVVCLLCGLGGGWIG